jgi:hypothetical protein
MWLLFILLFLQVFWTQIHWIQIRIQSYCWIRFRTRFRILEYGTGAWKPNAGSRSRLMFWSNLDPKHCSLFFCFLVVPDRIRTIPYVTVQPSCIRNLLFASGSFNPGSSSFLTPSSESGTRIRIHSYGLGSDFFCVADPDQGLNAHSRFPDPQPIFWELGGNFFG